MLIDSQGVLYFMSLPFVKGLVAYSNWSPSFKNCQKKNFKNLSFNFIKNKSNLHGINMTNVASKQTLRVGELP